VCVGAVGAVAWLLLSADAGTGATRPIGIATAARALQPGELVVLTLTTPTGVDRVRVSAFGHLIPATEVESRAWRALIGIDLDVAPGKHTVSIRARSGENEIAMTYDLVVKPRRFATRRLQVDEAMVNPPAAMWARIQQEAAELGRLWNQSAAEPLWTGPFVRPVPDQANSIFGTRSIFNGERRSPHSGTDFLSPAGTPIQAPNAGRVVLARSLYFTGNTLMIDHGLGLVSLFAHLSAFSVRESDMVSTGQIVGNVGATGRVTGPHLHWAVRANGARVDALSLLAVLGQ
jgi:murein DD-endopeptidase MepM/ murein hydrolase activator NlpD